MFKRLLAIAPIFIFLIPVFFFFRIFATANATSPEVIITEVKLGDGDSISFADGTTAKDFVSLYNQSDAAISLDGWTLEYAKAGSSYANCDAQFVAASATSLSGTLLAGSISQPIKRSMNDGTDGALRLIDAAGLVHDLVGWGYTTKCYEGMPAQTPPDGGGQSIQRYLDCTTNLPIDSGDNSADFALSDTPSPGTLAGPIADNCPVTEPDDDQPPDDGGDSSPSCDGVVLSEILPNPAGSDSGNEFVEIYNSTDTAVNLEGCSLQLNSDSVRPFAGIELEPNQYMAFYDSDTGITLPNSAGGIIYLLSGENELDSVDYPGGLDDNTAWARFTDGWQQTYTPTPAAENVRQPTKPCPVGQVRSEDTGRCRSVGFGGSTLKPCRPDQFRNPLTNRCKLKNDGSGLKPCRSDQFRNPLTNRCKLISAAGSSLKPCNPDQFRNPETNRCKKIDSGYKLKPCDPDQERNPETNRCRKVRGATSGELPAVEDVEAPIISGGYGWTMAGVASGGVVAYAGWEWRRELSSLINGLKARLPF